MTSLEADFNALSKQIDEMLTSHPSREKEIRKAIARALSKMRRNVSNAIHQKLTNDPRQTYKAVKSVNYRRLLGGNVSILDPKKVDQSSTWKPARKLRKGQWGGNRREQSARTKQLNSYKGTSRAFIMRFLEFGTPDREGVKPYRASISARNYFSQTAPTEMRKAIAELSAELSKMFG